MDSDLRFSMISVCPIIHVAHAQLLDNTDILHYDNTHNRILVNCANQSIPDGATAMATPITDGAIHEACVQVVGLLRQTLLMSLNKIVRESR